MCRFGGMYDGKKKNWQGTSFVDRILTLTGDDDYVAALVHWLSAR